MVYQQICLLRNPHQFKVRPSYAMRSQYIYFMFLLLGSAKSIYHQSLCSDLDGFPSISCNSTQILCNKGFSPSTGCSLGSYCYDMKHTCDRTCPCLESELGCQSGAVFFSPYEDCPSQSTCIPKETINSRGNACPNFCPAQCGDGFQICPLVLDERGCLGPQVCARSLGACPPARYDSKGCALREIKACKRHCPRVFDENGCPEDGLCAEDVGGECPVSKFDARGCPLVDPINCDQNEIRCSKGFNKKGCLTGFSCQKKFGDDGKCINYCPTICEEESEKLCRQGLGFNGCPLPDICIPSRSTKLFPGLRPINCTNHCRPPCDLTTHRLCPHVFDSDGCPKEETCIPRDQECPLSKYDAGACLIPETVSCDQENEILCIGETDINGCKLQDTCIPQKVGDCLQSCPANCGPNMIQCQNGVDEKGCKRPDTCVPKQLPGFDDCSGLCPTICNKDQVKCVITKKPEVHLGPFFIQTKHCVINEFCMDTLDKETNCTNFCPASCTEDEQLCEGPIDTNGCQLMNVCVPRMNRGGRGNLCSEHCPITCPEGERPCPGSIDSDSCRQPPRCVSKEERCPESDRDYLGCQIYEKLSKCEDEKHHICPGIFDERGCKGPSSCVPAMDLCPVSEFDMHGCPILDPVQCDWSHQKLCPTPLDNKKCATSGQCIEIIQNNCIQFCHPICDSKTQQICNGGQNANGCSLPKFCYDKNKICPNNEPFPKSNFETYFPENAIDTSVVPIFWGYPLLN